MGQVAVIGPHCNHTSPRASKNQALQKSVAMSLLKAILTCVILLAAPTAWALLPPDKAPAAPAFTHTEKQAWINSGPLRIEDLRGHVLLLDFWTFACWNCYRSFPWLNDLEERLRDQGLRIIGVHTPEFDYERIRSNIEEKVAEFELHHPVMIDNDHSYWRAMHNRYWPAFYLIDKQGRIRAKYAGETHAGDTQAKRIEADIQRLLDES